jgi:peroxiredoxin
MPKLISLNEQYKDKGLVMIFVAYESKAKLESYVKQYKITWPIAIEPTKTAQKAYGARGYPTSFVIAPNGKVAWKGHPANKGLEETIKALLPKVKKIAEVVIRSRLRRDISDSSAGEQASSHQEYY